MDLFLSREEVDAEVNSDLAGVQQLSVALLLTPQPSMSTITNFWTAKDVIFPRLSQALQRIIGDKNFEECRNEGVVQDFTQKASLFLAEIQAFKWVCHLVILERDPTKSRVSLNADVGKSMVWEPDSDGDVTATYENDFVNAILSATALKRERRRFRFRLN